MENKGIKELKGSNWLGDGRLYHSCIILEFDFQEIFFRGFSSGILRKVRCENYQQMLMTTHLI